MAYPPLYSLLFITQSTGGPRPILMLLRLQNSVFIYDYDHQSNATMLKIQISQIPLFAHPILRLGLNGIRHILLLYYLLVAFPLFHVTLTHCHRMYKFLCSRYAVATYVQGEPYNNCLPQQAL